MQCMCEWPQHRPSPKKGCWPTYSKALCAQIISCGVTLLKLAHVQIPLVGFSSIMLTYKHKQKLNQNTSGTVLLFMVHHSLKLLPALRHANFLAFLSPPPLSYYMRPSHLMFGNQSVRKMTIIRS